MTQPFIPDGATGELYLFLPPTHEEPIRTLEHPLKYFRLTWANSIVRRGGVLVSVKTVTNDEVQTLRHGWDYFRGGCVYAVPRATANELIADGFMSSLVPVA